MARRGLSVAPRLNRAVGDLPPVSVVLATRESSQEIVRRLRNLAELDYPVDRIELVLALDQTVAESVTELRDLLGKDVLVVAGQVPGKSAALNAGVAVTRNELLLFVDSAQTFAPDLLRRLVEQVCAEGWGAATGALQPNSGDPVMDHYWARELAIRVGQSATHSVICVTGCAYLMRRRYWRDMPHGLICDDLWSTYAVVTSGARVAIVPEAAVSDPRRFTRDQEYLRRFRTMTGLLQFVVWFPEVLNPQKNPMYWHFVLHKLIRPVTPILLLLMTAVMLVLLAQWSPILAAATLLVLGTGPYLLRRAARLEGRLGEHASTGVFAARLLFMPLQALKQALRGDWNVWKPNR